MKYILKKLDSIVVIYKKEIKMSIITSLDNKLWLNNSVMITISQIVTNQEVNLGHMKDLHLLRTKNLQFHKKRVIIVE